VALARQRRRGRRNVDRINRIGSRVALLPPIFQDGKNEMERSSHKEHRE
jgi:hypothetical protein